MLRHAALLLLFGAALAALPGAQPPVFGPAAAPDHVINVHAICHTHDDPGWLKTVDGYYDSDVRSIITTVVDSLNADSNRKFTYVEMSFFTKWWDEQNAEKRALAKKLVEEGRLEITIGGWVMPDEACPTYTDMIDQMTAGHLWLNETFGKVARPTVGWQIDPFGHSNGHAWLSSKFGFDSSVLVRIDYQDKNWRKANKELEFEHQPFVSDDTKIWTHVSYNHYNWPDGRSVSGSTRKWDAQKFANWAYNVQNYFKTPEILAWMGDDFQWADAQNEYKALDELIAYFKQHPELKVNLFYSTPKQYTASAKSHNVSYSLKEDDFWGYSDYKDDYWSGYFSSHPAFKREIRACSGFFHAARALQAFAADGKSAQKLQALWRAIAVTQHHDAITGTSKSFVYDDYSKQLQAALAPALEAAASNVAAALKTAQTWQSCAPAQEGSALCDGLKDGSVLALFNPLAWSRSSPVTVRVAADGLCAVDASGKQLASQSQKTSSGYELTFVADLAPSALATFTLAACGARSATQLRSGANAVIENEFLSASFTDDGRLASLTDKATGVARRVEAGVLYYVPENSPKNPRAGAYVMASNTNATEFKGPRKTPVVASGAVYQELSVVVDEKSKIAQAFRLVRGEPFLRMATSAGPVDVSDKYGKEVIVRLDSDVANAGLLRTDSNGLEFVTHKYNQQSTQWTIENPISGNFYPVSVAGYVADAKTTLGLVTDRAQGYASLNHGSLEALIHRRLTTDGDGKGVGEALDDKTAITTQQIVIAESSETAVSSIRTATLLLEHPVVAFVGGSKAAAQTLTKELPKNVHVTTLQMLDDKRALLRLQNIYAVGEDAKLSQAVKVDIAAVFQRLNIKKVNEVSLPATEVLATGIATTVELKPMQIRSFIVEVA